MDQPPKPPHARLVLLTRLLLYPLAIALIALWWHQRHARADEGRDGGVLPPRAAVTHVGGTTSHGMAMRAGLYADGRPANLVAKLLYACPADRPDLADRVSINWGQQVDGLYDSIRGDRVRTRLDGSPATWANGWHGPFDVHVDARFGDRSMTGTLTSTVRLRTPLGTTVCRSGRVTFRLTAADTFHGTTSQHRAMTVTVQHGRMTSLDTILDVGCGTGHGTAPLSMRWFALLPGGQADFSSGRVTWQQTWRPQAPVGRWIAMGPDVSPLERAGDDAGGGAATSILVAARRGTRLQGTLSTSIALPDRRFCQEPGRVTFDLAAAGR